MYLESADDYAIVAPSGEFDLEAASSRGAGCAANPNMLNFRGLVCYQVGKLIRWTRLKLSAMEHYRPCRMSPFRYGIPTEAFNCQTVGILIYVLMDGKCTAGGRGYLRQLWCVFLVETMEGR